MAKVTQVKSARQEYTCSTCGKKINKGDPYQHATPGFRGRKIIKCATCHLRQSELTTSNLSDAHAAMEQLSDSITDWDGEDREELRSAFEDAVTNLNDVIQLYQDAQDNWAGGNAENPEFTEKIEMLEESVSTLEDDSWLDDEYEGDDSDEVTEAIQTEAQSHCDDAWTF